MANAVKVLKHFETPEAAGTYHRLVCLTGKNKGLAYLIQAKRVVMGRSDKADVRVHDIKSSREHAEIVKVGKDFVLTDLGSQNGIVVNDLKVKQHVLTNGDKIIIGKTVYKFHRVEVKGEVEKPKVAEVEFEDEEFEETKNNKPTLILAIVAIGAIMLLMSGGEETPKPIVKKRSTMRINTVSGDMERALQKKRTYEDKELNKKLEVYFQKGLREFREGNYFRALEEFEATEYIKPQDPLAQFYIRKTKEALDRSIEESFLKAKRDEESLKYNSAITSYCSVIRLLYKKPDDERYIRAEKGLRKIEENQGKEEGEIKCIQEIQ
tara:strand:- start:6852 stop:7820 length:969 start_codon:yes stop_codon:yes gene_type:complete